MKHTFLYLIIFFAINNVAFAQENEKNLLPIPQKREEIKQYIEEKKSELQPQIQEKRQEIKDQIEIQGQEQKTKLQILAQERVLKIISYIFEQFDAILVKFDGITLRIDTRITKLKEQGIPTKDLEDLVLKAKLKVQNSNALIAASKIELQTSITTETSKESIKSTIESCKVSLKEAQASLVGVIDALKIIENVDEELSVE